MLVEPELDPVTWIKPLLFPLQLAKKWVVGGRRKRVRRIVNNPVVLGQFAKPGKVARLQRKGHWLCVQAERIWTASQLPLSLAGSPACWGHRSFKENSCTCGWERGQPPCILPNEVLYLRHLGMRLPQRTPV